MAQLMSERAIAGTPRGGVGEYRVPAPAALDAAARAVVQSHGTSDQAWFWTAEWLAAEREAAADIAAGRTTTYDSTEDFLASFDALTQGRQARGTARRR